MNKIEIFNETDEDIVEIDGLKSLLDFAIKHESLDNLVFNVIIVDNEYIRNLNKEYRNIDRETDVISFALEDYKDIDYDDYRLLGDIYISIDKARGQAIEYGHSLKRELSFLTIHGFLHLLGYDHMNIDDEKIMFKKQDEILNDIGIVR